jgi:hypothetical protein
VRDLAVLLLHLLATVARLAGPGGARSVVAESVLVKQQRLILNRSRKRSPRLRLSDRIIAGCCAAPHAPKAATPFRDRPEALNALEPSSSVDQTEISPAVLVRRARKARSKGTEPGSSDCCHRHERAEPDVGLSTDRSTDHAGLRDSDQQGCGAAHSRRVLPANTGFGRAIVARDPRSCERQSVESRSVSLCSVRIEQQFDLSATLSSARSFCQFHERATGKRPFLS